MYSETFPHAFKWGDKEHPEHCAICGKTPNSHPSLGPVLDALDPTTNIPNYEMCLTGDDFTLLKGMRIQWND